MSEPVPIDRRSPPEADRLESWKEIATYLGREVRTVQGWEKNEGLPVHRHQHARQGSVFAFKSELDAWREARKQSPEEPDPSPVPVPVEPGRPRWVGLVAGLAVVLLAGAGFLVWKNRTAPPAAANLSSIVVLPFLDLSPQ